MTDTQLHIVEFKNIIIDYYRNLGLDISVIRIHGFPNVLYLNTIIVPPHLKGFGSVFMQQFMQCCDDHKLIIGVVPNAKDPEKQNDFVLFFQKFGFKHVSDQEVNQYWNTIPADYIRLPKI